MRKFLVITLVGTAALLLVLYAESRARLKREAQRFDELRPEPSEGPEPPQA